MDLRYCLRRYNYFTGFTDYLFGEFAHTIRQRGYLVRRELVLIYVWKNFWLEDLSGIQISKSNKEIRDVTKRIFDIDHNDRHAISELLKCIAGLFLFDGKIPLKVASSVLTVVFPDKYGIFDARVGNTLQIDREDVDSCVTAIFKMREIAKEQEAFSGETWTPRMVDAALWSLDKFGK